MGVNKMAFEMTSDKPKKKKWGYVYVIQGNYGQGWEDVTEEDHVLEAHERLKEYNENEKEYPHRKIVRHVRLD